MILVHDAEPRRALRLVLVLTGLLLGFSVAQEGAWDIEIPLASGAEDAEEFLADSLLDPERWPAGYNYLSSSDLELGFDPDHGPQIVALRFEGVELPEGAVIDEAVVRFHANGSSGEPVRLVVRAQRGEAREPFVADEFGESSGDISSRPTSFTSVFWSPERWQEGEAYLSPDLSPLLREVRAGAPGETLVFTIAPVNQAGETFRSALSWESDPELSPHLLIRLVGGAAAAGPASGRDDDGEAAGGGQDAESPAPRGGDGDGGAEGAADGEAEGDAEVEAPADEGGEGEDRGEGEDPSEGEDPGEGEDGREDAPAVIVPQPANVPGDEALPGEPEEPRADAIGDIAGESGDGGREAEGDDGPALGEGASAVPHRVRIPVIPTHEAGVSGSVLLTDSGAGRTVVSVFLDGIAQGATYRLSVYQGRCGSVGQRSLSLEPLASGNAIATSVIDMGLQQLTTQPFHLNIFRVGNSTRLAGCADLVSR